MYRSEAYREEILPLGSLLGGRYLVEDLLGVGGMAIVYRVIDGLNPSKRIALKILRHEYANGMCSELFVKESKLMKLVAHPNVVRVFESARDKEHLFYTMEYVPGPSLDELIIKKEFTTQSVQDLIIDICNGLQIIHETSIIHCDLTPRNILFTNDGVAKITDFGLAHTEYAEFMRANQISGSLPYLAPEIWRGDPPTIATDLYSLGTLLYQVITGNLPFYEESVTNLMKGHLHGRAVPVSQLNPTVEPWLSELVESLIEKSPEARPSSARDVAKCVLEHC